MKYAVTVIREQETNGCNVSVRWTFTKPEQFADGEIFLQRPERTTFFGDTAQQASLAALQFANEERTRYQHVYNELMESIKKEVGL